MTPSEAIKAAHSTLAALAEHHDAIDKAEERRAGIETALAGVEKDFKAASARLSSVRADLGRAEEQLVGRTNLIDDEKARSLRDLQDQINSAQEQLRDLNRKVAERQQRHDEIITSMEALRKRLLG